ncbi:protein DCL homolog, chloroplastic isoform X1 [Dioscorea cayenensis subsp. rotundata]|uniref:Protein DCL homolog, chloroplastic isoform X1 n=1 Tax=Dioscorea cayennensis subsp. rotundata TaxID=55577 RepID=A0AB40BXL9_DIOCR|nr:protein DCL homolog, chloroplastic isoform X1 [Dioscorea cayenensis subsp. rotundata]
MAAAATAASLLLRRAPLLRFRPASALPLRCLAAGFSTADSSPSQGASTFSSNKEAFRPKFGTTPPATTQPPSEQCVDHPEYRKWKDREVEILEDIEPIVFFVKEILHSNRYRDGECLTDEDEKEVTEKLLAYHPHSEDKIGCGLDSIMVDRHPQFRNSRCLFVVRTDGGWIDFSYQKCLRAYIREKYPTYAERFIREHFKRS